MGEFCHFLALVEVVAMVFSMEVNRSASCQLFCSSRRKPLDVTWLLSHCALLRVSVCLAGNSPGRVSSESAENPAPCGMRANHGTLNKRAEGRPQRPLPSKAQNHCYCASVFKSCGNIDPYPMIDRKYL